eukprot:scaffold4129_cov82-Cyclotella_meneghiniana.AAC.5
MMQTFAKSRNYDMRYVELPKFEQVIKSYIGQCMFQSRVIKNLGEKSLEGVIFTVLLPNTLASLSQKDKNHNKAIAEDALDESVEKRTKKSTTFTPVDKIGGLETVMKTLTNLKLVIALYTFRCREVHESQNLLEITLSLCRIYIGISMNLPTASDALRNHHGTLNHGAMLEREHKQQPSKTSAKHQNNSRKGGQPKEQVKSIKESMSTMRDGISSSCIERSDYLYRGGTPEVERQNSVTTSFNYDVNGRSCEHNMGVISTCPQNPAKPSNKNMLALVVEEEETRATKRVKMKCNQSDQTSHTSDDAARWDSKIGACCGEKIDSPACWLKNGAIFKAFQAILTKQRSEPWNKEGRQLKSFVPMVEDTARCDSKIGACCGEQIDSPACWLKNGAIFKAFQAILTKQRSEPWNKEGRQLKSFVPMVENLAAMDSKMIACNNPALDMHQGDFIVTLQIQLVPGVPNFTTLRRGIRAFLKIFQKVDEASMIVSRELGKEQMISVTECSNNFPRKLEDLEKYVLMNNKWLVYHRPPTERTLKTLKAKKQVGPTSLVAHMQMKATTNSPLMIKEMIHATQIEMTCTQENIKVSTKHLQCLYSSTRYVIVGVDTFFHSVHDVKSAILSSLSSIGSEDTQVMFTIYQRRLKSFHTKGLACELSFERFRRSEQLAFHVEARDSDWNILAPLLSSKKASDMIKNLFGKSACVVKIPRSCMSTSQDSSAIPVSMCNGNGQYEELKTFNHDSIT